MPDPDRMPRQIAPFACPASDAQRRACAAGECQVAGQHGPPATDALQALIAALVQRHLPGPWQVVAVAPLAQWPRSLQRELTQTLGALTDTVVLVLERMPQ